jgi:altronate dehydratase small subunit
MELKLASDFNLALKVNPLDNVATIFTDGIVSGTEVEMRDKAGNSERIKVIGDIPYGHKIALKDITAQEPIIKYGEELGLASKAIKKGEYVHVHNLDSRRGRGELVGGQG